MAIKITENGVVNYENEPNVNRELFPNTLEGGGSPEQIAQAVADWFEDHPEAVAPVSVETIESTTPEIVGAENTRYICGEVSAISITPTSSGITDVLFYSGTTASVLTLPATVKMPPWFDASDLDTETWYEINILDGVYGAVMTWET